MDRGKMAAWQLVLCEPFIMSKVNKICKNVLSKYIIENMEAAAVTSAKAQLVKDTEDLQLRGDESRYFALPVTYSLVEGAYSLLNIRYSLLL